MVTATPAETTVGSVDHARGAASIMQRLLIECLIFRYPHVLFNPNVSTLCIIDRSDLFLLVLRADIPDIYLDRIPIA